jgi:hypothetical protein
MEYLSDESEHAFSQVENVLRAIGDRMRPQGRESKQTTVREFNMVQSQTKEGVWQKREWSSKSALYSSKSDRASRTTP